MVMPDMSKLEVESEEDEDIFKDGVDEVFPQKYSLSSYVSVGLDSTYVLLLDSNSSKDTIAAGLSNGSVKTYTPELVKKDSLKAHEDSISGLVFSPKEPNLLYTSSLDMKVKLWDLRASHGSCVKNFVDTSANEPRGVKKPLTSFSVNSSDTFLSAGTEQVRGDAFLLFWDTRSEELLGGYWNTHTDDITTLSYHAKDPNKLASGSVDGVVNIYDISKSSEDEALSESMNTESSVQKLKWYENEGDCLAIITHTEDVHFWNVSEAAPKSVFKREQIALSALKRNSEKLAYVVDAHSTSRQSLLLLCGSRSTNNSCLRLSYLKKSKLKPFSDLHSERVCNVMVRCSIIDAENGELLTGNESGIISKWVPSEVKQNEGSTPSHFKSSSSKSKLSHKIRPY